MINQEVKSSGVISELGFTFLLNQRHYSLTVPVRIKF
jgi:hypothetical protein